MTPFERLIPSASCSNGPTLGTEVTQYEFHVGPGPNNKILISRCGGPNRYYWQVMQVHDDHQSDWSGDFSSYKEALIPALWERFKAASPRDPNRSIVQHMLIDAISTKPPEVPYDEVSFGSPLSP